MFYALLFYLIVALFPIKRHFWANHDFSLSGNFCGAELNFLVSLMTLSYFLPLVLTKADLIEPLKGFVYLPDPASLT